MENMINIKSCQKIMFKWSIVDFRVWNVSFSGVFPLKSAFGFSLICVICRFSKESVEPLRTTREVHRTQHVAVMWSSTPKWTSLDRYPFGFTFTSYWTGCLHLLCHLWTWKAELVVFAFFPILELRSRLRNPVWWPSLRLVRFQALYFLPLRFAICQGREGHHRE